MNNNIAARTLWRIGHNHKKKKTTIAAAAVVIKCESLNKKKKISITSHLCSKAFGTRYALF